MQGGGLNLHLWGKKEYKLYFSRWEQELDLPIREVTEPLPLNVAKEPTLFPLFALYYDIRLHFEGFYYDL